MMVSIAVNRMRKLYCLARETVSEDRELAQRYVYLLRRIAQRTRTKIPPEIRNGICRRCNTPLIPGYNSTTRINQRREPHVTTTCHTCGRIMRRPLRRKTI